MTGDLLSAIQAEMIENILRSCFQGKRLTRDDATLLSSVQEGELTALLGAAGELRDRHKGKIVTFSAKVFIPLTRWKKGTQLFFLTRGLSFCSVAACLDARVLRLAALSITSLIALSHGCRYLRTEPIMRPSSGSWSWP